MTEKNLRDTLQYILKLLLFKKNSTKRSEKFAKFVSEIIFVYLNNLADSANGFGNGRNYAAQSN